MAANSLEMVLGHLKDALGLGSSKLKLLSMIFFLGWILSFMAGCTARVAYQNYGNPKWLDALVGVFGGLVFYFSSLCVVTSTLAEFRQNHTCDKAVRLAWACILGLVCIPIGTLILLQSLAFFLGSDFGVR